MGGAGNGPHVRAQGGGVGVDPADSGRQVLESGRNGIPPSVTKKDSEPCETCHLDDLLVAPSRCLVLTGQPEDYTVTHDELRKDDQSIDRFLQEQLHEQQHQLVAVSMIIAASGQHVIFPRLVDSPRCVL